MVPMLAMSNDDCMMPMLIMIDDVCMMPMLAMFDDFMITMFDMYDDNDCIMPNYVGYD